jgi:hypothetical protein
MRFCLPRGVEIGDDASFYAFGEVLLRGWDLGPRAQTVPTRRTACSPSPTRSLLLRPESGFSQGRAFFKAHHHIERLDRLAGSAFD